MNERMALGHASDECLVRRHTILDRMAADNRAADSALNSADRHIDITKAMKRLRESAVSAGLRAYVGLPRDHDPQSDERPDMLVFGLRCDDATCRELPISSLTLGAADIPWRGTGIR